jgi:hypothetical protein
MSAQKSSPALPVPPVPHPGARPSLILGALFAAQLRTRGPRWCVVDRALPSVLLL